MIVEQGYQGNCGTFPLILGHPHILNPMKFNLLQKKKRKENKKGNHS